jgi:hypothetical protein
MDDSPETEQMDPTNRQDVIRSAIISNFVNGAQLRFITKTDKLSWPGIYSIVQSTISVHSETE